jgi:hypothetical protein
MLDQVVLLLLRESKSEEPVAVHDIQDRRGAPIVPTVCFIASEAANGVSDMAWRSSEGREALDLDEVDAMGDQPVAHPCPRVGLPLLPSPHALGRNNQKGQPVAVGRLDDPGQIGARGSQLAD